MKLNDSHFVKVIESLCIVNKTLTFEVSAFLDEHVYIHSLVMIIPALRKSSTKKKHCRILATDITNVCVSSETDLKRHN